MPSSKKRIDLLLVERGLFESRARAQAAIEAGLVSANDKTVLKASETISPDAVLQAQPAHPFVSRGGVKLAGALEQYPIIAPFPARPPKDRFHGIDRHPLARRQAAARAARHRRHRRQLHFAEGGAAGSLVAGGSADAPSGADQAPV
jgi:ribosomal 50S subunit-recycling heat shock protein